MDWQPTSDYQGQLGSHGCHDYDPMVIDDAAEWQSRAVALASHFAVEQLYDAEDMVVEYELQGVSDEDVSMDTDESEYEWEDVLYDGEPEGCDEDGDISMFTDESSWMDSVVEEDDDECSIC